MNRPSLLTGVHVTRSWLVVIAALAAPLLLNSAGPAAARQPAQSRPFQPQQVRATGERTAARPNVLIAVSDDQSYPHASAYGEPVIQTPGFDRVARAGVLFHQAYTPAPGCSPMRAAFLTGRHIWQIEHAGTHASSFARKYPTFQERLQEAGYFVGYTGKGWGPGNWKESGRTNNPAGPSFHTEKLKSPSGISSTDYAANFAKFLQQRPDDQPFSFWFGGHEPHRSFQAGIGRQHGLDPAQVRVPAFLPDAPAIREDLTDYYFEIQWFDQHLQRMLELLEAAGELDNTLVIVTSDNGMAFPRAKANCYEYGIHMPLAISWPARFPAARHSQQLVGLVDVTATIYEASGVAQPEQHAISGRSLLPMLISREALSEEPRAVYSGRERHSSSRFRSLGYPQRALRFQQYLYIHNFRPERWPAGTPQRLVQQQGQWQLGPPHGGYHDIDACPSLSFLVEHRDDPRWSKYLGWAVDHRPEVELFDVSQDPACLHNLANVAEYREIRTELGRRLMDYLRDTGDPRVVDEDQGDVFETYRRYSGLRWFQPPPWAKEHPERVPKQAWLEGKGPDFP